MATCTESVGNKINGGIEGFFQHIGRFVASRPKTTLLLSILLAAVCGSGVAMLKTEDRPEKLWVPQGTLAEKETDMYNEYFPRTSRFNSIIVQSIDKDNTNILTKDLLIEAMKMHTSIESGISTTDKTPYTLVDLCTKNGGSCVNSGTEGICQCHVTSILREWNYDLETLENDTDILATVNGYGSKEGS